MLKSLCSVGLDVGTTTTQMVVSRLELQNRASSFAVPELSITRRQVVYESPVYPTPLLGIDRVDGPGIRGILEEEYRKAGLRREDVDTGAVIITGETSRKENARAVLDALAEYAGDFVVATAGPDLESILAAKGAGAVEYSARTGETLLHMDIGGGTSNLALIENGEVTATGCMNVGGHLVTFDKTGTITYVSPVLDKLCKLKTGEKLTRETGQTVARMLAEGLEIAAGLRPEGALSDALWTAEAVGAFPIPRKPVVISFSGGVADCIREKREWTAHGDLGPLLGQAIGESQLCAGPFRLGEETIRATVIGAGSHSAQLSGSTVFCRNMALPLKNLPAVALTRQEQVLPQSELDGRIRQKFSMLDGPGILALPGFAAPDYSTLTRLAGVLKGCFGDGPVLIAVETDMAKALGQAIALGLPPDQPVLCIDRVKLDTGSFLDVGKPIGPALPVVVKTIVLAQ